MHLTQTIVGHSKLIGDTSNHNCLCMALGRFFYKCLRWQSKVSMAHIPQGKSWFSIRFCHGFNLPYTYSILVDLIKLAAHHHWEHHSTGFLLKCQSAWQQRVTLPLITPRRRAEQELPNFGPKNSKSKAQQWCIFTQERKRVYYQWVQSQYVCKCSGKLILGSYFEIRHLVHNTRLLRTHAPSRVPLCVLNCTFSIRSSQSHQFYEDWVSERRGGVENN